MTLDLDRTPSASSSDLSNSGRRRVRFRVAVALLGALAFGIPLASCGASSTDTGNPPVVEAQRIRISPSGDGVRVSGGAGTVSPGGAEVEVTNLSTGESVTTKAGSDGSFEAELDGSEDDEFEVVVRSDGRSTSVSVDPSAPADDDADDDMPDDDVMPDNMPDDDVTDDMPDDDTDPAVDLAAELSGREFLLDSSEGFSLVEDTTLRLSFRDAELNFSAGCNSHFAGYTVCDGNLCIDGIGSTEIGCTPELAAQDMWLAEFFGSQPSLMLDADQLTITGAEATLVFLDSEVADPDRPLTGATWTVDTFIDGGAASNFALQDEPTLLFNDDGNVDLFTGCNNGSAEYAVDGDRIAFSNVITDDAACEGGANEAERRFIQVVTDGLSDFEIDANRLTLMRGDVGISATTE